MSLPLSKATYRARAASISFGISSKGNNQIGVMMVVVDDENFSGENITWLGHFTEKTQDRTIESLQHMGWKGDDLSELDNLDALGCDRLLPDVVDIVCAPEEYDGETNLKVQWINKPGAGRFSFKEPLTGSNLKSFAAQMRGTIRSTQGANRARTPQSTGNGSAKSTEPHPNAPTGKRFGDSDIPF